MNRDDGVAGRDRGGNLVAAITGVACLTLACAPSAKDETVPAGSTLIVRLTEPLSSEERRPGDHVSAETISPLYGAADILIPAGARVDGKILDIDPYGNARMTLAFVQVENWDGEVCAIRGRPITIVGVSSYRPLEPSESARHGRGDLATTAEPVIAPDRETMIVPTDPEGAIELPRGQALAVHIVEPASLSAAEPPVGRTVKNGEDETS